MLLVLIVVVILGHNLGNSQVSVYRTIGPTLVLHILRPLYSGIIFFIDHYCAGGIK